MPKILQFKPPHGRMVVPGIGEVHNGNITKELYDKLVEINPAHKDFFHEVDAPEPKSKEKSSSTTKQKANDVQA